MFQISMRDPTTTTAFPQFLQAHVATVPHICTTGASFHVFPVYSSFQHSTLCAVSYSKRHEIEKSLYIYIYIYVCRFQNIVLRCPTPRLHCFLSSHWPSFRFLSFIVFLIHSIQFFFDLSRALFCFGIHFNAILSNLPSAIL